MDLGVIKILFSFLLFIILLYHWIARFYFQAFLDYPNQFKDFWDGLNTSLAWNDHGFSKNSFELINDSQHNNQPSTIDDIEYFIHVNDYFNVLLEILNQSSYYLILTIIFYD